MYSPRTERACEVGERKVVVECEPLRRGRRHLPRPGGGRADAGVDGRLKRSAGEARFDRLPSQARFRIQVGRADGALNRHELSSRSWQATPVRGAGVVLKDFAAEDIDFLISHDE